MNKGVEKEVCFEEYDVQQLHSFESVGHVHVMVIDREMCERGDKMEEIQRRHGQVTTKVDMVSDHSGDRMTMLHGDEHVSGCVRTISVSRRG